MHSVIPPFLLNILNSCSIYFIYDEGSKLCRNETLESNIYWDIMDNTVNLGHGIYLNNFNQNITSIEPHIQRFGNYCIIPVYTESNQKSFKGDVLGELSIFSNLRVQCAIYLVGSNFCHRYRSDCLNVTLEDFRHGHKIDVVPFNYPILYISENISVSFAFITDYLDGRILNVLATRIDAMLALKVGHQFDKFLHDTIRLRFNAFSKENNRLQLCKIYSERYAPLEEPICNITRSLHPNLTYAQNHYNLQKLANPTRLQLFPVGIRVTTAKLLYVMNATSYNEYFEFRVGADLVSLLRPFSVKVWLLACASFCTVCIFMHLYYTKDSYFLVIAIWLEQGISLPKPAQTVKLEISIGLFMLSAMLLRQFYLFDMYSELTHKSEPSLPGIVDAIENYGFIPVIPWYQSIWEHVTLNELNKTVNPLWSTVVSNLFYIGTITHRLVDWSLNTGCRENWDCQEFEEEEFNTNKLLVWYRHPANQFKDLLDFMTLYYGHKVIYINEGGSLLSQMSGWSAVAFWDREILSDIIGRLDESGICNWLESEILHEYLSSNHPRKHDLSKDRGSFKRFRNMVDRFRTQKDGVVPTFYLNMEYKLERVKNSDIGAVWTLLGVGLSVALAGFVLESIHTVIYAK